MDRDPAKAGAFESIADLCAAHPLGGAHHVVLEDRQGLYAGIVALPDVHAEAASAGRLDSAARLARAVSTTLDPQMDVRSALALFDSAQSEILAVVDPGRGVILGTLGEAYAARRFAEALDAAARGVLDAG